MKSKSIRLLSLYDKLLRGKAVIKREEAAAFEVSTKTIQRDIEDIRAYLAESKDWSHELIYDSGSRGYRFTDRSGTK